MVPSLTEKWLLSLVLNGFAIGGSVRNVEGCVPKGMNMLINGQVGNSCTFSIYPDIPSEFTTTHLLQPIDMDLHAVQIARYAREHYGVFYGHLQERMGCIGC
jgi:hypothetical protein